MLVPLGLKETETTATQATIVLKGLRVFAFHITVQSIKQLTPAVKGREILSLDHRKNTCFLLICCSILAFCALFQAFLRNHHEFLADGVERTKSVKFLWPRSIFVPSFVILRHIGENKNGLIRSKTF